MPLCIISGLPLSGKSTAANCLADFIRAQPNLPFTVEIVRDDDYGVDRAATFSSSTLEKQARSNFLSALERKVTRANLVIADGLNYIKGFRYQLYCIARAAATPHCVLTTIVPETTMYDRNNAFESPRYPVNALKELHLRYEEPSYAARWDSPLFSLDGQDDRTLWDLAPILAALCGNAARPPSMSTAIRLPSSKDGELFGELDRVTQGIVDAILKRIREVGVPTAVSLDCDAGPATSILIKRPVQSSDLQRLRKQFVTLNRLHLAPPAQVRELFVKFLEGNLS